MEPFCTGVAMSTTASTRPVCAAPSSSAAATEAASWNRMPVLDPLTLNTRAPLSCASWAVPGPMP
ncbi:MAG: hypothetical protein M3P46_01905 [Actinomycetota bacterium]|nr:hypothetical protein [Actinomycetota bacterium]